MMSSRIRQKRYVLFAVVLIAAVLGLTHIPQKVVAVDLAQHGLDKLLHGIAYALIAFCLFCGLKYGKGYRNWILALLILTAVAGVDEWTQQYVGRTASLADFGADIVGILAVLFNLLQHSLEQRRRVDSDSQSDDAV